MSDDTLIVIYRASNEAEAALLSDALSEAGVEASVEQTASPFDGVAGLGDTRVFVRQADRDRAGAVLERFLAEQGGRR
jgi:hypothetical protein